MFDTTFRRVSSAAWGPSPSPTSQKLYVVPLTKAVPSASLSTGALVPVAAPILTAVLGSGSVPP